MFLGSAHFDLARCVKAAEEGRLGLGKTKCRIILLELLGDFAKCDEFALVVLKLLTPNDFNITKTLDGGVKYDEYGIRLPVTVLDEFGLTQETWYVKFTLREGTWGEETYCLSLHPLNDPMNCVGGRIVPSNRDWP
ncbi:hypothetical protein [Corallococcus exiguus]|uniref:hypothetical protein n=1 Tax=Corallococcus exiguus TaxID=83462 RepID=UPI003DA4EEA8